MSQRIAYYISAHGYGHAARSVPILEKLTRDYAVTVKTEIPAEFFRGYLHGPYSLIRQAVDPGCAQGNFVHIDTAQCFRNLRHFFETQAERLNAETRWLRENRIDLILADAASMPLQAGHRLGIPSLLLANFTWHDIYSSLPGAGENADLIEILRDEYATATLQFLPQCHIINTVTTRRQEIGFIALQGQNVRQELQEFLDRPLTGKTLVFIYLGEADSSCLHWERLPEMADCVFITRDPFTGGSPPANLFVLDQRFRYPDLIASADLVCTKAGYSTLATAFHHGKPVISCRRDDFCEFPVVKDYLERNRLGVIADTQKFYACDWAADIEVAQQFTIDGKVPLRGEDAVCKTARDFL